MLSLMAFTEVAGGLLPPIQPNHTMRLKLLWENVISGQWDVARVVSTDTGVTPRDIIEQQAKVMNRKYGVYIDPAEHVLQATEPPGVILDSRVCPQQKLVDFPWVCGKVLAQEEIEVRVLRVVGGKEGTLGNTPWLRARDMSMSALADPPQIKGFGGVGATPQRGGRVPGGIDVSPNDLHRFDSREGAQSEIVDEVERLVIATDVEQVEDALHTTMNRVAAKLNALDVRLNRCARRVAKACGLMRDRPLATLPMAGKADAGGSGAPLATTVAEASPPPVPDPFRAIRALAADPRTTLSREEAYRRAELEFLRHQELYEQMMAAQAVREASLLARVENLRYLARRPGVDVGMACAAEEDSCDGRHNGRGHGDATSGGDAGGGGVGPRQQRQRGSPRREQPRSSRRPGSPGAPSTPGGSRLGAGTARSPSPQRRTEPPLSVPHAKDAPPLSMTAESFTSRKADPVASTLELLELHVKNHLLHHDALVAELFSFTSMKLDALQAEHLRSLAHAQRGRELDRGVPQLPRTPARAAGLDATATSVASDVDVAAVISGIREVTSTSAATPHRYPQGGVARGVGAAVHSREAWPMRGDTDSFSDDAPPAAGASRGESKTAAFEGRRAGGGVTAGGQKSDTAAAPTHSPKPRGTRGGKGSTSHTSGPARTAPPLSRAYRTLHALDNELLLERSEVSLLAHETYLDTRAGAPSKKSVELYMEYYRLMDSVGQSPQQRRAAQQCTEFKQAWGKPVCANCGATKASTRHLTYRTPHAAQ